MNKKWVFNTLAVLTMVSATSVMILTSCGENYCVMGIAGNCNDMYSNAPATSGGSGTLNVASASGTTTFSLMQHPAPTFTVSGGNGTYNWTVHDGGCGTFLTTSTAAQQVMNINAVGTGSTDINGHPVMNACTIQVTDTTSPNANIGYLTISVRP